MAFVSTGWGRVFVTPSHTTTKACPHMYIYINIYIYIYITHSVVWILAWSVNRFLNWLLAAPGLGPKLMFFWTIRGSQTFTNESEKQGDTDKSKRDLQIPSRNQSLTKTTT